MCNLCFYNTVVTYVRYVPLCVIFIPLLHSFISYLWSVRVQAVYCVRGGHEYKVEYGSSVPEELL